VIQKLVNTIAPFLHPGEQLPIYSPGKDVATATEHRVPAIAASENRALESWASPAERSARPFGRTWYLGQPGCTAADRDAAEGKYGVPVACDEFPNCSMANARPGASLLYIPASDSKRRDSARRTISSRGGAGTTARWAATSIPTMQAPGSSSAP
jgi:hypothetical protein